MDRRPAEAAGQDPGRAACRGRLGGAAAWRGILSAIPARTVYRTAIAFAAIGVAAVAAAYLAPWDGGIEGAYFDRAVGSPALAGYVDAGGAWWVPSALFGAGVALVLSAAVLAALAWRVSRRAAS